MSKAAPSKAVRLSMLRPSEQLPLQRTYLADALLGACLALLAAQMWRPNESPVTSTCSLRMSPSTSRTRSLMRRTRLITYRSARHSQRLHGSGSSRTASCHAPTHIRTQSVPLQHSTRPLFSCETHTTPQVHGIEARAEKRRDTPVCAQLSSHLYLLSASCILSLRMQEPHH